MAAEAWGYPVTLLVDAITGLACLLLLPALKRETTFSDALAQGRARKSALVLGLACLAWLPYWANHELLGRGQPIMGTFFTLVFVASALFLLAGREVLGAGAGAWRRAALWMAPLLLAMYGRYFVDRLDGLPALRSIADVLVYLVPLAGGIVLLALASRDWRVLERAAAAGLTNWDTMGRRSPHPLPSRCASPPFPTTKPSVSRISTTTKSWTPRRNWSSTKSRSWQRRSAARLMP